MKTAGRTAVRMAAWAILPFGLALTPASADILYDNHKFSTTLGAYSITSPFSVSDSFTLSTSGSITGFSFVVELLTSGDALLDVDWAITSAPFAGTTYASGTGANPTQTSTGSTSYYTETLAISSVTLPAGTYWLQLSNAIVTNGDNAYWADSNGPSQVWQHFNSTTQTIPVSEAFKITGTALPEPGSFAPIGLGFAGIAVLLRGKCRPRV